MTNGKGPIFCVSLCLPFLTVQFTAWNDWLPRFFLWPDNLRWFGCVIERHPDTAKWVADYKASRA